MIETRSLTHTCRLFADKLSWTDMFRVILYAGYRGDLAEVPSWYRKIPGHSCLTDLSLPMDDIMAAMKSNTRNEIRRAIKEGCAFAVVKDVHEFVPFYNAFCASKGFPDYTDAARLKKFRHILITKAMQGDQVLAMHVNQLDSESHTALLILSGSQRLDAGVDKKLIGWGNRFLHYKELEYLKDKGYTTYDWSGICLDPNDEKYSIGQFKLGFGGKLIESPSLMTPLYALLERVRAKVVKFRG